MKGLGILLVLWGTGYFCLQQRRDGLLPVQVGRAILDDLSVVGYQIRVCRTPLPDILEGAHGLGADWLWRPLLERLRSEGARGLPWCWQETAAALPPPLDRYLAPLGPLLPAGGERLAAAIEETREELAGFLRDETDRQASRGRVTAALCLSGACLLILVLI